MADITQWEYKNITYKGSSVVKEETEKELNQLGKEGWELAGTFSNDIGRGTMIFKRPKQPKQEKLSPEAAYWERICR